MENFDNCLCYSLKTYIVSLTILKGQYCSDYKKICNYRKMNTEKNKSKMITCNSTS